MVALERLGRRAVVLDPPFAEQKTARSQRRSTADAACETKQIVPPALLELEDLAEALALERLVADGEHLVEQQDVGVDVHRDREAKPHVHARGVGANRQVDEALELGEGDDLVHAARGRNGA